MSSEPRIGFSARLPLELDRWIEAKAAANRRSKNAEIIVTLEAARAAESAASGGENPAAMQVSNT